MEFFDWAGEEDIQDDQVDVEGGVFNFLVNNQVPVAGVLDTNRVETPFERCLRRYTIFNKVVTTCTRAEFIDSNSRRKMLMDHMMSSFAKCLQREDYRSLIPPSIIRPDLLYIGDFFEALVKCITDEPVLTTTSPDRNSVVCKTPLRTYIFKLLESAEDESDQSSDESDQGDQGNHDQGNNNSDEEWFGQVDGDQGDNHHEEVVHDQGDNHHEEVVHDQGDNHHNQINQGDNNWYVSLSGPLSNLIHNYLRNSKMTYSNWYVSLSGPLSNLIHNYLRNSKMTYSSINKLCFPYKYDSGNILLSKKIFHASIRSDPLTYKLPAKIPRNFFQQYFALVFPGCEMLYQEREQEFEAILDTGDCICNVQYLGTVIHMFKNKKTSQWKAIESLCKDYFIECTNFEKTLEFVGFVDGFSFIQSVFEQGVQTTGRGQLEVPVTLIREDKSLTNFVDALLNLLHKGEFESLESESPQVDGTPQLTLTIRTLTDNRVVMTCTPMTLLEANLYKLYDKYLQPNTTAEETIEFLE